jgi:hypothetical protein
MSFSRQILGSEANQNNKKIFLIFVIFVKLLRGDISQVPANVAEIKNKWLQNLHPGVSHSVFKTDSFRFIYMYVYIISHLQTLTLEILFYHVFLLLYELKYLSAWFKIYDLVKRVIMFKVSR